MTGSVQTFAYMRRSALRSDGSRVLGPETAGDTTEDAETVSALPGREPWVGPVDLAERSGITVPG
ncbi:hypothetical protein G3M53_16090 [Streptomyces sp. SID7982]|nr:hypothetical protein [Streptomyces sp. SID7982]